MKIRLIVIGMAACFLLPLAGSNAGVVFDAGLSQAAAGTNFERAVNTAVIFGRHEDDSDHDRCDDRDDHGKLCCEGDHRDWDDKGDHDKDHHGDHDKDCEKSPSKPHH